MEKHGNFPGTRRRKVRAGREGEGNFLREEYCVFPLAFRHAVPVSALQGTACFCFHLWMESVSLPCSGQCLGCWCSPVPSCGSQECSAPFPAIPVSPFSPRELRSILPEESDSTDICFVALPQHVQGPVRTDEGSYQGGARAGGEHAVHEEFPEGTGVAPRV